MATSDDHMGPRKDANTAILEFLNQRYSKNYTDIALLHQRFLNEGTAADSTRSVVQLRADAEGKETT